MIDTAGGVPMGLTAALALLARILRRAVALCAFFRTLLILAHGPGSAFYAILTKRAANSCVAALEPRLG
jgi:hypothetical protein